MHLNKELNSCKEENFNVSKDLLNTKMLHIVQVIQRSVIRVAEIVE